jgi:ubiquinone/menaquinone biosynthesis C-methylase UbiE
MHEGPIAAGKSSFDIIDREIFFREIDLPEGTVLLDAACGSGRYSLALSEHVGDRGLIYAIDLWEEGVGILERAIREKGIVNIRAFVGDLRRCALEERAVDAVLLATVLHDLVQAGTGEDSLAELKRVMRPGGRLYVVEFRKVDGPPGPPGRVRISEEELRGMLLPFGFREEKTVGTGPATYLSVFRLDT